MCRERCHRLATTVAFLAFTADGHTKVVIGARANELEEIVMTRPHKNHRVGRDRPAHAGIDAFGGAVASPQVAGESAAAPGRPPR